MANPDLCPEASVSQWATGARWIECNVPPSQGQSEYLASRSGLQAQYGPTGVAYLQCDSCDPPSTHEDVEIFVAPAIDDGAGGSTFTVSLMLLQPADESKLSFSSGIDELNAEDYGKLYMTKARDYAVMASAANKTIHAMLAADSSISVQKFGFNSWGPLNACDTSDGHCPPGQAPSMAKIEEWISGGWEATSNNRGQVNHYAGTCPLGECASATDGSLVGTTNVYVADGSLLRRQLRAHPVLTVMALASEVAARIRAPSRTRVRITFTELRGASDVVQLSEVEVYSGDTKLPIVSIANHVGHSTAGPRSVRAGSEWEAQLYLNDGVADMHSKWIDRNFTSNGYSELILVVDDSLGAPNWLQLVSACCNNARDPVSWTVEVTDECGDFQQVASVAQTTPPEDAWSLYPDGPFPLGSAVLTSRICSPPPGPAPPPPSMPSSPPNRPPAPSPPPPSPTKPPLSPSLPPPPPSEPPPPPACYGDWIKARGNLRCSITQWRPSRVETVDAASADECCAQIDSLSSADNPISAWQFESNGTIGTCVLLKQKYYQTRGRNSVKPAGRFAKKSCTPSKGYADVFTYFRNFAPPTCPDFGVLIGNVRRANGVDLPGGNLVSAPGLVDPKVFYQLSGDGTLFDGASAAGAGAQPVTPPATHVAKGFTANECCEQCSSDAGCSAWQMRDGACIKVDGSAVLAKPDVPTGTSIRAWAHSSGEGLLYHREPRTPDGNGTSPDDPDPSGSCPAFQTIATNGKSLLAGDITSSAARADPTDTIIWSQVTSVAGCCEVASRYACTENPVVMFQLVGTQCVLKRKRVFTGYIATKAAEIAAEEVPHAALGHIFYAESPPCGNAGGELSPCAKNGLEGSSAGVCTGNEQETCYFDVSCKSGGLGCYAGGWESCRVSGCESNP